MENEVTVDGKSFVVKEMKAIDLDSIDFTNTKEAIKKQVMISTGITESNYAELTVKERLEIIKTINEINGLNDFQKPTKE